MRRDPAATNTMPRTASGRGVLLRAFTLAGTALLAATLLAWSPSPVSGWNQSSAESTLWQLLNGARVNNGRNPLQRNSTLVSLARWRSKDMITRDYFDHTVLGTSYQVFHWYDTNGLKYQWGGENIGWNNGYSDADSPVAIHEGFMNSPGHRANILEPAYTDGGVGAWGADNVSFLGQNRSPRMYTELFMVAAATNPPPPPPPTPAPAPSSPKPTSPPSGGGSTTPAPAATQAETAAILHVDDPAPPSPDSASAAASLVVAPSAPASAPAPSARQLEDPRSDRSSSSPTLAAASYRIQAADASNRGLFETVFGSLLGFFLG
jgi:uncharacterized protein YkwD